MEYLLSELHTACLACENVSNYIKKISTYQSELNQKELNNYICNMQIRVCAALLNSSDDQNCTDAQIKMLRTYVTTISNIYTYCSMYRCTEFRSTFIINNLGDDSIYDIFSSTSFNRWMKRIIDIIENQESFSASRAQVNVKEFRNYYMTLNGSFKFNPHGFLPEERQEAREIERSLCI